jgi:MFS family permease
MATNWLTAPGREEGTVYGLLAAFSTEDEIKNAARKVRQQGYTKFDAHTPYPVHGLERAMGLGRSKLPFIMIGGTITGIIGAFILQYWTGAIDYKLIIGNKQPFSWQFAVPVMFELGVLLTAFGAVFGMLALNLLPRLYHPLFNSEKFKKATDDTFFISIESKDPLFNKDRTAAFLKEIGSTNVEVVEN